MKKFSIAYFGTPYFSARFLEKLLTDKDIPIEVQLVVTQPDAPVGRKQTLTKSPVKTVAEKYNIKILDIENLKLIRNWKLEIRNLDMAFLFAYGDVIPNDLLHLPKLGFLNTHPSLLPKYCGPSPMAYPLMLGDTKTGVTLIKLDEQIDHGPIIAQKETKILPHERRPDIEVRLTDLAYELFKRTLNVIARNEETKQSQVVISSPQNHSHATFTRQLEKNDGFIPLSTLKKALNNEPLTLKELPKIIMEYINKYNLIGNWKLPLDFARDLLESERYPRSRRPELVEGEIGNSSQIIFNYFRGLYPWPGVWTLLRPEQIEASDGQAKINKPKRLKITDMDFIDGKLTLKKVQMEGKKEVGFKTFNRAYSIF